MKNLFENLFGKKTEAESDKGQQGTQLADEALNRIIEEIKTETSRTCNKVILKDAVPALTDSKLGGLPYIPHDESLPLDSQGRQLKLLAQINCRDIHDIDFPECGLLQFFINTNRLFGLNSASPTEQTGFAIKYYAEIDETVSEDEVKSKIIPQDESSRYRFPLIKEVFSLDFQTESDFISAADFRFDKIFTEKVKELFPDYKIDSFLDLPAEHQSKIFSTFSGKGSKLSGYPHFSQDDPRSISDRKLEGFEMLLLQIDSDEGNIQWGDSGTGNFFMEAAALADCDFSKVLYNWDCL